MYHDHFRAIFHIMLWLSLFDNCNHCYNLLDVDFSKLTFYCMIVIKLLRLKMYVFDIDSVIVCRWFAAYQLKSIRPNIYMNFMNTEQTNREKIILACFRYRTRKSLKVNTGNKMENIVTFSIAYITLFESFQTMPIGSCEG